MTSISSSALTSQSVWNRFIAGADRDGDGSISGEELAALAPEDKGKKAMTRYDANGDGLLSRDELPEGAFSPTMYSQLLTAQEYRDADPETRRADDAEAIADMFARADVDGDGVLSAEEWDAERTLNMSRFIDGGELPDIVIIARPRSENGLTTVGTSGGDGTEPAPRGLRPEDFLVGRKVDLEAVPIEDLPEDWAEQMAEIKRLTEQAPEDEPPQMAVLDPETMRADMIARIEAMPMSATFMTRLIMSLSEGAGAWSEAPESYRILADSRHTT